MNTVRTYPDEMKLGLDLAGREEEEEGEMAKMSTDV